MTSAPPVDENTKEVFKQAKKDIVGFLNVQKQYNKGEAEVYFKELESKLKSMKENESK